MNVFLTPVPASELHEFCEGGSFILLLREEQAKFHFFEFKSFDHEHNTLSVLNVLENSTYRIAIDEVSVALVVTEKWPPA